MKINKIAAATALSLVAGTGALISTATPASAFTFGTVTASQTKNLSEGDVITVNFSGFGTDTGPATTVYITECTPAIVSPPNDPSHCDESDPTDPNQSPTVPEHVTKVTDESNGAGSGSFTIHTGSNWLGTAPGDSCGGSKSCYIVVTDGQTAATTNWAGFVPVTFSSGGSTVAKTKTVVKAPKTAKAGKTVKLKVTTTKGSKYTGSVTVTDNGKKVAKVKEAKSGKVTVAVKKVKKGTNKFVAKYSGDSANKASSGKATVKVKK